jgi:hypothetical protein
LGRRGALVGPKGHGKTTLLEDLRDVLQQRGWRVHLLRLSQEAPRLPKNVWTQLPRPLTAQDMLMLDGAEQMSLWRWLAFRRHARAAGGLLITTHRPGRLPTLLQCETSPVLLEGIVETLLGELNSEMKNLCATLFRQHHGNVRDCLRTLYDLWADEQLPSPY